MFIEYLSTALNVCNLRSQDVQWTEKCRKSLQLKENPNKWDNRNGETFCVQNLLLKSVELAHFECY
jgi:hypothetical protein